MDDINFVTAKNYKGYLDKKSPNLFAGFQRRYIRVLDGKILAYFGKEKEQTPKGLIEIKNISQLTPIDKKGYILLNFIF